MTRKLLRFSDAEMLASTSLNQQCSVNICCGIKILLKIELQQKQEKLLIKGALYSFGAILIKRERSWHIVRSLEPVE